MFLGFGPEAFWWFDGLERDNSRDYITRTRDLYEREVRGQLDDATKAWLDQATTPLTS